VPLRDVVVSFRFARRDVGQAVDRCPQGVL